MLYKLWKSVSFGLDRVSTCWLYCLTALKVNWVYSSTGNPCQSYGASHSVTFHPTQVNAPRLNPSHAGRYSIYLPRSSGRLSWPWCLVIYRDGLPVRRHPSSNLDVDSDPTGSRTLDRKSGVLTIAPPSQHYIFTYHCSYAAILIRRLRVLSVCPSVRPSLAGS